MTSWPFYDPMTSFTDRMGSGTGSRKSSGLGARSSAGKARRQVSLDGPDDKPYQMSNPQAVGLYLSPLSHPPIIGTSSYVSVYL